MFFCVLYWMCHRLHRCPLTFDQIRRDGPRGPSQAYNYGVGSEIQEVDNDIDHILHKEPPHR